MKKRETVKFFQISGFVLFFIGLWMILDPRRSYILDLVDFSEDDPLLRFAAYTCIVVGSITSVIAFFACCGSIKGEKCLLSTVNFHHSALNFSLWILVFDFCVFHFLRRNCHWITWHFLQRKGKLLLSDFNIFWTDY